jgi:hypothetical protein
MLHGRSEGNDIGSESGQSARPRNNYRSAG